MSGSDPGDLRPLAGEGRSTGRRWPRPQLVAPSTEPPAPAVAGIDAHNHLGRWLSADGSFVGGPLDELVELMAGAQLTTVVNLDGRWGEELEENLERYDRRDPRRVVTFCHLDWRLLQLGDAASPECQRVLAEQLADSARRGARGVKVWKDLGLGVRDASGALVLPDDPRVVGVLRVAGELGLPVLIHTADPVAFFEPLDADNERLDELTAMPSWWFGGPGYPTFERLLAALHALVAACPETTFVGAHVGGMPRTSARWAGRSRPCPTSTWTQAAAWASSAGSRDGSGRWWRRSPTGCCSGPTASPWTPPPYAAGGASWRPRTSTSTTASRVGRRSRATGASAAPRFRARCCPRSTATTPPGYSASRRGGGAGQRGRRVTAACGRRARRPSRG
ncbi:MAG: amidohydrolase family protein [Nocardioides sp.]